MSNCLRADFVRLFRSRFFRILMIFFFGTSVFMALDEFSQEIENYLLTIVMAVSLLGAVFTAFFIGTDYSDGTIRNKLIVGNGRAAVYFSNLIICCAAAELMYLSFALPMVILGSIVRKVFLQTAEELLFRLLIQNIALLASIALIVLVTMLVQSRSSAIVIGTLLLLGLFVTATIIEGRLDEPEYFQGMMYVDEEGNLQYDTETKEANPYYLRGTARKVLEVAFDVLPGGQMEQMKPYYEFDPAHGRLLLLYSAGVIAATILIGVPTFQRGNLK